MPSMRLECFLRQVLPGWRKPGAILPREGTTMKWHTIWKYVLRGVFNSPSKCFLEMGACQIAIHCFSRLNKVDYLELL